MKQVRKINLFFPIILVIILSSCVSQKKLIYLQNKEKATAKNEFINERNEDYKVQPGDNLYIKITSIDEKTAMLFNSTDPRYSSGMNDIGVYLNSYTVADDGSIDFPLTGKIQIQNLTIEEVKGEIKKVLDEYLKETMIIVKLINFNITMLGEIKNPGQYKIYQDKINLFEAIAMAGDLGDFSNRNKIKLIRQSKQGAIIHELDLTNQNILESDFFYLMPNDVIYIEPLKGKQFTFANFPYSLVFSAVSTTLLLINFFK